MRRIRTFIAVEVSDAVRKKASEVTERWRRSSEARVNWVAPENLHITLKFLAEQTDDEVALICRAVQQAARDVTAFSFECQGTGAFPDPQRPRTLWIGVHEGAEGLIQLHDVIQAALAEHGYPRERRAFVPHLTIGRVRSGGPSRGDLAAQIDQSADLFFGSVTADSVLVYGSHLQRRGPRYEVLARAPLSA